MQQVLGVRGGTLRAQRGKGHLGPPKGLASGHQDRTGGAGAGDDSRSESQMIGQKDRGTGAGGDPLGACLLLGQLRPTLGRTQGPECDLVAALPGPGPMVSVPARSLTEIFKGAPFCHRSDPFHPGVTSLPRLKKHAQQSKCPPSPRPCLHPGTWQPEAGEAAARAIGPDRGNKLSL